MAKQTATGLDDIQDQALRTLIGTRCLVFPTLAIATTAGRVKTTSNISYSIKGVVYYKAATDNLFIHTDLTVQAADTTKYYALCLDADAAASIIPGTASALPVIPDTKCCIGYIKVVTVAVTFTPATTSHAASGVTTTYNNIVVPPVTLA